MGGKCYGDGCGDETWIELAQDSTIYCSLVLTVLKRRELFPQFKASLSVSSINPLKPELSPICYLLALLAHHFLHVGRIRVKSLTLRLLMSYVYGAPILDVSRSHTTTHHSR